MQISPGGGLQSGPVPVPLRDVIAALSVLPVVKESDIQAIVARAAAEPARVIPLQPSRPRWFTSVPLAAAAGLVLAAGVGGFLLSNMVGNRGFAVTPGAVASVDASAPGSATAMQVNAAAADPAVEAPIMTQFVLDAPAAAGVSLVGAFNGWDASATPLVRDPATGLWSVSLPLAPGRHVYAFMVDGRTLTLDPRVNDSDPEGGARNTALASLYGPLTREEVAEKTTAKYDE